MKITIEVGSVEELRQVLGQLVTPKQGTSIEVLNLSVRSENCLMAENIRTVEELRLRSTQELLKIPNLGKTSTLQIQEAVREYDRKMGLG